MKLYPESAPVQLEFDKICSLLHERCRTEYAREKAANLRIHTRKDIIDRELLQTHEYKQITQNAIYFPSDYACWPSPAPCWVVKSLSVSASWL
jgi:DNA mismatch repair protein MutS2